MHGELVMPGDFEGPGGLTAGSLLRALNEMHDRFQVVMASAEERWRAEQRASNVQVREDLRKVTDELTNVGRVLARIEGERWSTQLEQTKLEHKGEIIALKKELNDTKAQLETTTKKVEAAYTSFRATVVTVSALSAAIGGLLMWVWNALKG